MSDVRPADLPEHLANPFCAILGPPPTVEQQIGIIERKPAYHASERRLPAHLRRYCVLRLFDDGYVFPQSRQLQLVERIGMAIRQGYRHRNPAEGGHRKAILDAVDRVEAADVSMEGARVGSSAVGLTVVGQPGLGKTLTTELALNAIPRIGKPDVGYHVVQVPWLKMECPTRTTRKQLCIEFFEELDRRLRQDTYRKRYGNDRTRSPAVMLLDVQLLCQIHAIGILVVDEIQNLADSPEGPDTIMTFLVSLVNKIGVPVLPIGTMKAAKVIGLDFRQARRSSGLHQPVWLRSPHGDADWSALVTDLWGYQWTAEVTLLTDEIRQALYDESQGIVDILIKLVVLVQFRVILLGEVAKQREVITADIIAQVASEDMQVIRPMIRALREGREDILEKYHDLRGFHSHVADVLGRHLGRSVTGFRQARVEAKAEQDTLRDAPNDPLAPVRAFLLAQGLASDLVEETLRRATELAPAADTFTILPVIKQILDGSDAPGPGTVAVAPGPPKRVRSRASPPAKPDMPPDDLRAIAARARASGMSVHAGLSEAGLVVPAIRVGAV